MEERLLRRLREHGWSPVASQNAGYDMLIVTAQGKQVLELKRFSGSTRDLHAALLHLALVLEEHADIDRAYLVASMPRMTHERAVHEWERVLRVLRPRVAKRLAFVAAGKTLTVMPDDEQTHNLALLVEDILHGDKTRKSPTPRRLSGKFFEVWKVLFGAWLRSEGPIQVGDLAKRAGCSYPTVAKILDVLQERRELDRDSSRSVQLAALPRQTLREVMILQESLRRPIRFQDSSGRRPNVEFLLKRLEKIKPLRCALSGVVAARHYDPNFDLNGLPRLDVTLHGPADLDWVSKVDPALSPMQTNMGEPVLVVHPLRRPKPEFIKTSRHKLPIADAVETLLDLFQMGFNQQAEDLIKVLRGSVNA